MWKLLFDSITNVGTGCNREALEGEYSVDLPPSECAWFMVRPSTYKYVNGSLEEVFGWEEAELAEKTKNEQELAIRVLYQQESEYPVEALGVTWNGGQDSAGYIQGAVSLAQALGESSVFITDINNMKHELSFTDALTISAMIGKSFRTAFYKKQDALFALNI